MHGKAEKPDRYRISQENAKNFTITISWKDGLFWAQMLDEEGKDVLEGGADKYVFRVPGDTFARREHKVIYAGFMAANGTQIWVDKSSVFITLERRKKAGANEAPGRKNDSVAEVSQGEMKPLSELSGGQITAEGAGKRCLYASPDGRADAPGTREAPNDLQTAVDRIGNGGTLVLLSGMYHLSADIVIRKEKSGTKTQHGHLCSDKDEQGSVILDFGGTVHGLLICADHWDVTGIGVTRGYGLQILGSYNRIIKCRAFENLETGILIRHPDNDAPECTWPSFNLVEDCISYKNKDLSERNADGFACKVAAGKGNRFLRCRAWLNSDDGFDCFSKNRKIGAVKLAGCISCLNGYEEQEDGTLKETFGNGSGFKLGGSGLMVRHEAVGCMAVGNKQYGFTSNSNPWLRLKRCRAVNNQKQNIVFYFTGRKVFPRKQLTDCVSENRPEFDAYIWLRSHLDVLDLGTVAEKERVSSDV